VKEAKPPKSAMISLSYTGPDDKAMMIKCRNALATVFTVMRSYGFIYVTFVAKGMMIIMRTILIMWIFKAGFHVFYSSPI
jgi:hypothetical protein